MSKKNAFVTGVSSGLGEAFAKNLLARGYHVYGLSRRTPQSLQQESYFHFVDCDLSDLSSIKTKLSALLKDVSSLDLAILNAGIIGRLRKMSECSLEELQAAMDVNVWANKFILDHLIEHNILPKQVIGISSGASQSGSKGWAGYSLSKAGLNMLLKLYASENEESHFTALAPGLVLTNMLKGLLDNPEREQFPSLNRLHSSAKFTPQESAEKILDRLEVFKSHPSGSYLDLRDLLGQESF